MWARSIDELKGPISALATSQIEHQMQTPNFTTILPAGFNLSRMSEEPIGVHVANVGYGVFTQSTARVTYQDIVLLLSYYAQRVTGKDILILTNIMSKVLGSSISGDYNDGLRYSINPKNSVDYTKCPFQGKVWTLRPTGRVNVCLLKNVVTGFTI